MQIHGDKNDSGTNDLARHSRGAIDPCAGIVDGLRTPIAVLRASLESLAFRFEERDPRQAQVVSAIAQVARLQHNVLTLIEDRRPVDLAPLPCTLQEIAASAVRALVPEHRTRTLVAVESGARRLVVDGPIVSRTLTRLIESGLDDGATAALLRVHSSADRASFHVLHGSAAECERERCADAFQALALRVAERDVARMGGTFRRRTTTDRVSAFEIVFEIARAGEEAA